MTAFFNLNGCHILVTGASSGIGRGTAILLSQLGAKITLVGRNESRLNEVITCMAGNGHVAKPFDLCQVDNIPLLLREIANEHGALDGLFHGAGIDGVIPVQIMNRVRIDSIFDSSIYAALMLCRGFLAMRNKTNMSSIVIMSSISAQIGTKGYSVYSASKAAIDGAIKSLACEFAPANIRINSIVAGAVKTEMHDRMTQFLSPEACAEFERKFLLGFGTVSDISSAAAFLLSPLSKWITGTSMVVDGGFTCQ